MAKTLPQAPSGAVRLNAPRLNAEERRRRIVAAALPLFARQGFAGTTTKEIAAVADVSEALLFKHFPTKAALYGEILDAACRIKDATLERLNHLEPSTLTLVRMTYAMVHFIVVGDESEALDADTRHRLMLNSLLDDGEYARLVFETVFAQVYPKFRDSLAAAEAAGDLASARVAPENRFWFAQHVAAMIAYLRLAGRAAAPYRGTREELVREAAWFVLRGCGLRNKAIKRDFDAAALAAFAHSLAGGKSAS